ncbi:hypothetical protein B0T21DRAFT_326093 [Apiosordaria backusii]|uniref:Uncharacterized protein n=1 Tax=Apiosordaria backusii TaxID=314023 RepID=A0AA40K412_9PEZI|nr:hypothetical protein B0T21DRAFT_326093 [Apiosordaria backusii]
MGGSNQPYMYEPVLRDDERFPVPVFDPKAVTRASYEKKKPKPKPNGPLVSINRHPDAHGVPNGRTNFRTLGRSTKGWIKGMRVVQLCLRVLELTAALGFLTLYILLKGFETLTGWVMRVTFGVVIIHCIYSIYHHSKPASGKTPGSSAAYQVFGGISDLAVLPLYTYGIFSCRNQSEQWGTLLSNETLVQKYFVPSLYYGLMGAAGLHLVSLAISLWLGIMFRRISMMPPDMNPLETRFTSRAHKRNKSSIVTTTTYSDGGDEKRIITSSDRIRDSLPAYDPANSRPPSIPFMHTRQNSSETLQSRDSRMDLPSRQYQIPHNSNRSSGSGQDDDFKRMSAPPTPAHGSPTKSRASYTELPLGETDLGSAAAAAAAPRPKSMYNPPTAASFPLYDDDDDEDDLNPTTSEVRSYRASQVVSPSKIQQPRSARFTEAWYTSDSLVNRTAVRNPRYQSLDPDSDSNNSDNENDNNGNDYNYRTNLGGPSNDRDHPNPLRSNPTPSSSSPPPPPVPAKRPFTPFSRLRNSILGEINLNDRRVSGDITEQKSSSNSNKGLNRQSSIQQDSSFYSKPYGDLRARTPPVIVGSLGLGVTEEETGRDRQVSSGNDFDLGGMGMGGGGARQRHVSGREAEEGRAGMGIGGVTPPPLEIRKQQGGVGAGVGVKGGHVAAMRSRYSVLNE